MLCFYLIIHHGLNTEFRSEGFPTSKEILWSFSVSNYKANNGAVFEHSQVIHKYCCLQGSVVHLHIQVSVCINWCARSITLWEEALPSLGVGRDQTPCLLALLVLVILMAMIM